MPTRLVRRGSAALRPAAALAVFGTLLAGCAPERAAAPDLQPGALQRDVAAAALPTLVITEIQADPAGTIADDKGEWFEVYNPGSEAVSLAGWKLLSNNAAEAHTIPVASAASVPAGGYALLGNNGDATLNGGLTLAYQYPVGFQLANSNTAEKIELRAPDDRVVDIVTFGRGATSGRTFMLRTPACDNALINNNANWVLTASGSTSPYLYFTGNFGTPGAANDSKGSLGACVGGDGIIGPLDAVAITGPATVNNGATITLTAAARDADGDPVTAETVTWSDGDSPLVTVTPTGARTATVQGDGIGGPVTITATLTVGGVTRTATASVTVNQAPIPGGTARLDVFGYNAADLPVGFEDQLLATAYDASNIPLTIAKTWRTTTPDLATIDATSGLVHALKAGRAYFVARTADGFENSAYIDIVDAQPGPANYANHLEFGQPTDATPADEHIVTWPQFVASYNRNLGQPNWVAYNLEASHRGPALRCDCFTHDPSLPADFPHLTTLDYIGSGYSRGHMTMSEDRTAGGGAGQTSLDNARTFLLSNVIPQAAENNEGPWLGLETHLGNLATTQNKEIFILAGGAKHQGTLNGAGKIAIPTFTWKVAVVLPRDQGLANVQDLDDAEIIAVVIPNSTSIPKVLSDWPKYRVTVDSVEALTGYDVLAALPNSIEEILESGDRAPTAAFTGPATGVEGTAVTFTSTSTDPDVTAGILDDVLSFAWTVDGAAAGIQSTLTRAFVDDGTYSVRLIVSDRFGRADTTTKTITVANVAPAVNAVAGATILRGETYTAAGTFTDPGADTWTATVNYGDGSGAQPLALSGKGFTLSHTYATAGSYTVTVTVNDDDAATGTRTATVVVETAVQGVGNLADLVQALGANASIPREEANSLAAKLRASAQLLGSQPDRPAGVAVLEAFINEITAMQQSGRLTEAKATALIDYARRVIASA